MTHNNYHLLLHAILLEEALRVRGGRRRLVIIGQGREFQFISSSGVRFFRGQLEGLRVLGGSATGRLLLLAAGGSAAANACANEALLAASLWRLDC